MDDEPGPYLSVVIPAYNEERRLPPTLARIKKYLADMTYTSEIIVVDNNSRDRTADVARQAGVTLLQEPRQGKGAAVRTGMLAARGEYLLFSDADLSTPIEDVELLFAALRSGCDIAIASRALPGSNLPVRQPWHRELVGRVGNLLVRLLAVHGIADTQCGFKLFPRAIASRLFGAQLMTGIAFDMEVLFLAQQLKLSIAEVPVTWRDSPLTRISRVRDSLDAVKDLLRIRLNWLRRRYPSCLPRGPGGQRRGAPRI
jgi:dolichyl-phosphate beta-glucosyltransferase